MTRPFVETAKILETVRILYLLAVDHDVVGGNHGVSLQDSFLKNSVAGFSPHLQQCESSALPVLPWPM